MNALRVGEGIPYEQVLFFCKDAQSFLMSHSRKSLLPFFKIKATEFLCNLKFIDKNTLGEFQSKSKISCSFFWLIQNHMHSSKTRADLDTVNTIN